MPDDLPPHRPAGPAGTVPLARTPEQQAGEAPRPLVLVTVGTDHHPFDRMVIWVDNWLAQRGPNVADVLVQYGASRPPVHARGERLLAHDVLTDAFAQASVVLSHGGPATIVEARRQGLRPFVLPRAKALGEHVDDHQQAFARVMHEQGSVVRLSSERELHEALDRAIAEPQSVRLDVPHQQSAGPAIAKFASVMAEAVRRKPKPTTVLFLGGLGRSGSTLLERLLAQVPGCVSVGELVFLWTRGLADGERCGCGEPLPECPFWSAVGRAAFGGWSEMDLGRVSALARSVDRSRNIPLLLLPWQPPRFRRRLTEYADTLTRLYAAIAEVSGAEIVIDSSKHASTALLLRRVHLDLRVTHVVRDSRAVAHSWSRIKKRPEAVSADRGLMQVWKPGRVARFWLWQNVLFELAARLRVPTRRLRYEDLLRDPATEVRAILDLVEPGLRRPIDHSLPFLSEEAAPVGVRHAAQLGVGHTVAGNPMRFESGWVPLRLDDAWQREMPHRTQRIVALLTRPLMRHYGYDVRPSGSPDRRHRRMRSANGQSVR